MNLDSMFVVVAFETCWIWDVRGSLGSYVVTLAWWLELHNDSFLWTIKGAKGQYGGC